MQFSAFNFFALYAAVAVFAAAPSAAFANDEVVTVKESTQRFEISARSFDEFRRKLRRYGLREFGDSSHGASTAIEISYDLDTQQTDESCILTEYTVTAEIEYFLPLWIEHDSVGPQNAKKWQSFYAKARLHEDDHGRIAKGQALEVAGILSGIQPATNCSLLIAATKSTVNAYIESNTAQKDYDRHTRRDPSRRSSFDFEAAVRRR